MITETQRYNYTLAEIDALRWYLYHYLSYRRSSWQRSYWQNSWTRAQYDPPDDLLENYLRTYMMAGIRPEEMKQKSQEAYDQFEAAKPKDAA